MSSANSGFTRFGSFVSNSEFSLSGPQVNMDQLFTVNTSLPADFPMPFFGYIDFQPASAQTVTLPTAYYHGTRVFFNVNTNASITRPVGSTYVINGASTYNFPVAGYYFLLSIDNNQYSTIQLA